MSTGYFLQQCLNALTVSAFYSLVAVAYVLMHGVTRRFSLAFGALAVWSGYVVINISLWLMVRMPYATVLPVGLAAIFAVIETAAVGHVTERLVVRPLIRQPSLAMLVATLGLALVLEELMRIQNGSRELWLQPILNVPMRIGGSDAFPILVTPIQIIVLAIAIGLCALIVAFISHHPFGRVWRATSQDPVMAELAGVDVGRVVGASFALAAASAGAAGALLAIYYGAVSFYFGLVIGLKTLFVAVVGGLDSVRGAFAGALMLGVLETFWSGYVSAEYRDVASFVVLTGLLILFPAGLFAGARRVDHA
ncbi:MAG: branched-chain amino acid ABC transporter permease [Hyphomicrobiaceae bacterium]